MKTHRWVSVLVAYLFFMPTSLFPQSEAIEKGVSFLLEVQNDDGSWSSAEKRLVDTDETVQALVGSGDSKVMEAVIKARFFVANFKETDNDKLAHKLSLLAGAFDVSELVSKTKELPNPDGGWGLTGEKESDPLDTMLLLDALIKAGVTDGGVIGKARDFLTGSQEEDGTWIFTDERSPSDVARASLGMLALGSVINVGFGNTSASASMAKSRDFLDAHSSAGAFGPLADTALAYLALLHVRQPATMQQTLEIMLAAQEGNGSWENDIFTTALVLQALEAVRPPELDLPDLSVGARSIAFLPPNPNAGDTIQITATVFNKGSEPAQNVQVKFVHGDPLKNPTTIGQVQISAIAEGGSALANVNFDTQGLTGEQKFGIIVDPSNAIRELSESNNLASRTVTLAGQPDLALAASDLAASGATPDDPGRIELVARVRNTGTDKAEQVIVRFLEGTTRLGETTLDSISQDTTGMAASFLTLTPGPHTITVIADPDGAIQEKDETNNQASILVDVQEQELPDLAVNPAEITFSNDNPLPGESVEVKAIVRNLGKKASASFRVRINRGDPFTGSGAILAEASLEGLAAGGSAEVSATFTMEKTSEKISVFSDSDQIVVESLESNNLASRTIQTPPIPDISVSPGFIFFSHLDLRVNPTVLVKARIDNLGTASASSVLVRFQQKNAQGTTLVGEQVLPMLAGCSTAEAQTLWHPPVGIQTLIVTADPEMSITELNENNNKAEKTAGFVGQSSLVTLFEVLDGQRYSRTIFFAYSQMEIVVVHGRENVRTEIRILSSAGELVGTAPLLLGITPAAGTAEHVFLIRNLPPGLYKAELSLKDKAGLILEVSEKPFEVPPMVNLQAASPLAIPSTLFVSETKTITFTVQVTNGSNLDAAFGATLTVTDPDGQNILTKSVTFQLGVEETLKLIDMGALTQAFDKPGRYPLEVRFSNVPLVATSLFTVLPVFRAEIEKTIQPEVISAREVLERQGSGRVRVLIRVRATE